MKKSFESFFYSINQRLPACCRQAPVMPKYCLINMSTWDFSLYAVAFFTAHLFCRKKHFVKSVDATPPLTRFPIPACLCRHRQAANRGSRLPWHDLMCIPCTDEIIDIAKIGISDNY